jgi:hypothetical protein
VATLQLRDLPDEVVERLSRLADREGLSLDAFVLHELSIIARRAENLALVEDLPDLAVDPDSIVSALRTGRTQP